MFYHWTVIHVISLLPRSRGNSINYTSVSFAMQIRFPWFTPQSFFPKLFHHHQQATWESSKQETKTLYNWKPVKPLLTRRNTEEVLRFFLLAAATHTTIQTPKHPCNPKKGEVAHKKGLERVSNTLPDTKAPSQSVLRMPKNLQKTSRNLKNLRIPLSGAPKRGRKAPKALANKDKPRQRAAER